MNPLAGNALRGFVISSVVVASSLATGSAVAGSGFERQSEPPPILSPRPRRVGEEQLAANRIYRTSVMVRDAALQAQRNYLVSLPENWDGYGAPRIAPAVIDRLYDELRTGLGNDASWSTPDIIPGSDGSIQAEWHIGDLSVEYNLAANGQTHFSLSTPAVPHLEFFGKQAVNALSTWRHLLWTDENSLNLAA